VRSSTLRLATRYRFTCSSLAAFNVSSNTRSFGSTTPIFSSYIFHSSRLAPSLSQFETRGKKKKGKSSGKSSDEEDDQPAEVDLTYLEEKMNKTLDYLTNTLAGIRTERLSPSLIENILVEIPGKVDEKAKKKGQKAAKSSAVPLRTVADISILDHRNLIVHAHDEALEKLISKALNTAEGGFNPEPHEGRGIKVPIPKMTIEFRDQLEKTITKHGEESKESLRRTRREGMDQIKRLKAKIGKDEAFRQEKKVTALLDKVTKVLTDKVNQKIAEIRDTQ